ncbi:MAG TPA: hypothetical protein VF516_30220 [Kofleriaceae bacterium]
MDRIERFLEEPVAVLELEEGAEVIGITEGTPRSKTDRVMLFDVGRDLCRWLLDNTSAGLVLDPSTPIETRLTREQLAAIVELDREETYSLLASTLVVPRNEQTGAPIGTREGFIVVFRDPAAYGCWKPPVPCSGHEIPARDVFENLITTDLNGVVIDPDSSNERWIRREGLASLLRA